jgi:opacity protein-like surface antigen
LYSAKRGFIMGQEPTMTVRGCLRCGAIAFLLLLAAAPARADITAFIGANTTPDNRQTRGLAAGIGLLIVGFEFEYADTPDSTGNGSLAPSLKTGMGNVLLQTPFPIAGFQPYFTTGIGVFRESLGTHQETSVGFNTGGGVKVNLIGPLRLRVDYRVFKLTDAALYSPSHRIYAGLNLKF